MRSMTGFGSGSAQLGDGRLRVEIRALNHRYQDVRVRTSNDLSELGFFAEHLARKRLGRGRYDLSVRSEGSSSSAPRFAEERIKSTYRELSRLRDEVAPGSDLSFSSILGLPGILDDEGVDDEAAKSALTEAFDQAAGKLARMRELEGGALAEEIRGRIRRLDEIKAELERSSAQLLSYQRQRLKERVERLLEDTEVTVGQQRLEQEIALLADKSDITEELVRLQSHFSQLSELSEASEPVGRRFDFLLQEVGREVNTIGSKSQQAEVAHLVVEMKAEVERLREQVQNVD